MMIPIEGYVRKGQWLLRRLIRDPRAQLYLQGAAYLGAGFLLSAASLLNGPLTLAMGLVAACSDWPGILAAVGGSLGYLCFWGGIGQPGILWCALGMLPGIFLGSRRISQAVPLLIPALSGLLVSGCGVAMQIWLGDTTPVGLFLLQVVLAMGSTWLFGKVLTGRNPILDWLACALGVLALAQLGFGSFSLGVVAGGALAVIGAFPAAALAGVALDLTGICAVSMTAVLCGGYLLRFLTRCPKWLLCMAPTTVCILIMSITGTFAPETLPALLAGGFLGGYLPVTAKVPARRGETGVTQVRLEMAAGALNQARQLLTEAPEIPVDEDALVTRAAEEACSSCPCRNSCKDSARVSQMSGILLHKPLLNPQELPVQCRKSGRVLAQLHRGQEQLRSIRADRQRQREYREAVTQQYLFLSRYLQSLSDQLSRRIESYHPVYSPWIRIFANRPEYENGDRILRFAGVGCRYYVVLCDGMGTGPGAVREAKDAQKMLQRLITAGFPAEYALRSLNSLCALRSRAGAVTVDLLELQLETGRAQLFKWGAVPSYVISPMGAEKVGVSGPPPGMSVSELGDAAYHVSLQRGETLVLVSDGVGEEEALHCCLNMEGSTPEELAKSLLTCSQFGGEDDATVILVRLESIN